MVGSLPGVTRMPSPNMPKVLPGFEHVNRYWDRQNLVFAAKILPGEYYVTASDEMITTVLGSCVSACVRDTSVGVGGMNHFMLPHHNPGETATWGDTAVSSATRYGSYAMEHLINDILKLGGRRSNLEVKLFGGGKVLAAMTDVGSRNISFVEEYLKTEGLAITGQDMGDVHPRKVNYYPASGRVRVKKLRSMHNDTIVRREREYMHHLAKEPVVGDIDLF
jgi:chemotaxis protein CheD